MLVKQTEVKQESDSLRNHKIPMRIVNMEKSMDNQAFDYLEAEDNGMKIILEFPRSSQNDTIISEVKSILSEILNEYLKKAS